VETLCVGFYETKLTCEYSLLGNDLLLVIYGGTHPHIGAVALGIPRESLMDSNAHSASVSILTLTGHKDDEIAREIARSTAASLRRVVTVIVGIHLDQATEAQIQSFIINARSLAQLIVEKVPAL
jgi:gallate decarboxylase subunit D